ncbi:MAG: hypothetical protein K0Q90_1560 [Paenibacillaceae bacterium]|nr:hypothetical protein [Paenibacillaceae bacterium]
MNEKTANHELVITRIFEAPRELVFQAFTDAEHLKHWWGPEGAVLHVVEFDLSPGGSFRYYTESEEGVMWVRIAYQEIAPPERLVFVNSFSDEAWNLIRAPFWQEYPLEIRNVFIFEEENGRTTLTMKSTPVNAAAADLAFFSSVIPDVEEGFGGTFERLAAYVAKLG